MAIFRGIGGSGDATGDASNQAIIAINAANAALVSSGQAATSAAIATAQADLALYNATVASEAAVTATAAAATATAASLLAESIATTTATTILNSHVNSTTDAHDASAISNIPSGNLVAVNVQTALDELQTDVDTRAVASTTTSALSLKVDKTSSTGSAVLPVGTTAQRDAGTPTGYLRYNSTLTQFEGYGVAGWGKVGGGATGGGTDAVIYLNGQTITSDYTIPAGQNAGSFGPITIADGVSVEIPTGSSWSIV